MANEEARFEKHNEKSRSHTFRKTSRTGVVWAFIAVALFVGVTGGFFGGYAAAKTVQAPPYDSHTQKLHDSYHVNQYPGGLRWWNRTGSIDDTGDDFEDIYENNDASDSESGSST